MKLGWALPGTVFPQSVFVGHQQGLVGVAMPSNHFQLECGSLSRQMQSSSADGHHHRHDITPGSAGCTVLPGQESSSFAEIPPVQGQPLHPRVLGDLSLSFSCSNMQTLVPLGTLPGVWCPLGPPAPVRWGMWRFPGKACFLLASFVLGGGSCTCEQHVRSR